MQFFKKNNVFFDSLKIEISFCIAKSFQEEYQNNKLKKTVLIYFVITFLLSVENFALLIILP